MNKDSYHHGDLKKDLILNGLSLLNLEGPNNFSLRKVAALCNVSHTAPYKHFKNKEELIKEISIYVQDEFNNSLQEIIDIHKDANLQIIELGKKYVSFMVEHPDYLKFLFLGNLDYSISMTGTNINGDDNTAFSIFKKSALRLLNEFNVPKENHPLDILSMWTMVHGISILLSNNTLKYEGDYLDLVEKLLTEKLKF
ncbi:MAG: TetR/AcrR family transcriptional regulator [Clostridium sp.]